MNNLYIFTGILIIILTILSIYLYNNKENKEEKFCNCGQRFSFPYGIYANLPAQGLGSGYARYSSCMCK